MQNFCLKAGNVTTTFDAKKYSAPAQNMGSAQEESKNEGIGGMGNMGLGGGDDDAMGSMGGMGGMGDMGGMGNMGNSNSMGGMGQDSGLGNMGNTNNSGPASDGIMGGFGGQGGLGGNSGSSMGGPSGMGGQQQAQRKLTINIMKVLIQQTPDTRLLSQKDPLMQLLQVSKGVMPSMKQMDMMTDGQWIYGVRIQYNNTNWVV